MYAPLLTAIRATATFDRAEQPDTAMRMLSDGPEPSAVLITDEALTLRENSHIWDAVLEYVRRGGTAIVMGLFPSFVQPDKIKTFFARASLRWERGSYHRTTLSLNENAVGMSEAGSLPRSYSQKALFVKNVSSQEMWYRTNDDSVIESRVFPPTSANVGGEAPVALAKVGQGKLGYVGDVNAEEASHAVVLAMCGI